MKDRDKSPALMTRLGLVLQHASGGRNKREGEGNLSLVDISYQTRGEANSPKRTPLLLAHGQPLHVGLALIWCPGKGQGKLSCSDDLKARYPTCHKW